MRVFHSTTELKQCLANERANGARIGAVLTMGALHEGHLSLVRASLEGTDVTVVSIFVNPLQFNDPADHVRYPRQLEKDIDLLMDLSDLIVFAPERSEVFSGKDNVVVDLGELDRTMEGSSRPGHFDGVVQVVYRLFDIIEPTVAYFGEKDRQQLLVIIRMVEVLELPVVVQPCATVRSEDGLALSSRNALFSNEERRNALAVYRALQYAAQNAYDLPPEVIVQNVVEEFNNNDQVELEYFKLIDQDTLQELKDWDGHRNSVAFIAARIGAVRSIDNMVLKN